MIISFSGMPGMGKTLTMIKLLLLETRNRHKTYINMSGLRSDVFKYSERIQRKWMFKKTLDEEKTTTKKEIYKIEPDWDFWEKSAGCSVMLDECHNFIDAVDFSNKESKCCSKWVAQIRKICEDSGDFQKIRFLQKINNNSFSNYIYEEISNHSNLYITSQTVDRINKNFRDISNIHIHCQSVHIEGAMIIFNYFFFADNFHSAITNFQLGIQKPKIASYVANEYFDLYSRNKLVRPEGVYL